MLCASRACKLSAESGDCSSVSGFGCGSSVVSGIGSPLNCLVRAAVSPGRWRNRTGSGLCTVSAPLPLVAALLGSSLPKLLRQGLAVARKPSYCGASVLSTVLAGVALAVPTGMPPSPPRRSTRHEGSTLRSYDRGTPIGCQGGEAYLNLLSLEPLP